MKSKLDTFNKYAIGLIGLLCLTALAVNVVPLWNQTARDLAWYRPGDCVRSPIVDQKSERWERVKEPEELYMISEVGNEHYRMREWGTKRSTFPQWYQGYNAQTFTRVDDRKRFQPIPCPEQGPDPEPSDGEFQQVRFSSDGTVFTQVIRVPE